MMKNITLKKILNINKTKQKMSRYIFNKNHIERSYYQILVVSDDFEYDTN